MKVTVFGMGKIGLPLAVQYALRGAKVVGVDINADVIGLINSGVEPFPGESGLQSRLTEVLRDGNFYATSDWMAAVSGSDVCVVVVPLFVDQSGVPEFQALDDVTTKIGQNIGINTLICYETTVPVGTTRQRFTKRIEALSGFVAGNEFNIVFSPERVLTGRVFNDLAVYPKIIGGVTEKCGQAAAQFYSKHLPMNSETQSSAEIMIVDNSETAEMVKLAETTYRDVNIGLANQFANFAKKSSIDINQVIRAANSQPYSNIHSPGIAVGGHCIPVYPQLYLFKDEEASIVRAAREANNLMPHKAVERIESEIDLGMCSNILILGVTYRQGVKETYLSGALKLRDILKAKGHNVFGLDPLLSDVELSQMGFEIGLVEPEIDVIILQNSDELFLDMSFQEFTNCKIIYDGRKFLDPIVFGDLKIKYLSI